MPSIEWKHLAPELESSPEWSHSGIAVTDGGDVVFAEPAGGGLVFVHAGDRSVERRAVPLLEIHGISCDPGRQRELLWLADPGFKARPDLGYEVESRAGVAGSLDLATFAFTPIRQPDHPAYETAHWQPTSVVAVPARDDADDPRRVIVADGYGAFLVHFFLDGELQRTTDGRETGTAFSCPHGLVVDARSGTPEIVVADRGNRRLVVFTIEGALLRVVQSPLFTSPSSLAIRGGDLLVTELDGAVLAVDVQDAARELIATRSGRHRDGWPNAADGATLVRPRLEDGRLNSPHGIAVSPDGRIYLTEWLIGGRQLELTITDEH